MNKKLNIRGLKKSKKHTTHKTHADYIQPYENWLQDNPQVLREIGAIAVRQLNRVMMKGLVLYVP